MPDDALSLEELEALIGGRVEAIEPITETPMQITKEQLEREIASLQSQKANALAVAHGADGAIQAYNALLATLAKPEPVSENGDGQDAG